MKPCRIYYQLCLCCIAPFATLTTLSCSVNAISVFNIFCYLRRKMKTDTAIVIKNKKARHFYDFIEKYVAGIQLCGTEIKSIRMGKASIVDAYCYFARNELYVRGMHISEYWWGNINNHNPDRDKKLLLGKRELRKLERKIKESGLTIIATTLFINNKGLAKLEIALARGKKEFDKRETLKQNDAKRDIDRIRKTGHSA